MEISKELSERIYSIKKLHQNDLYQIRILLLDFFAAAFAGYKQNKSFNDLVQKVIFDQEGKPEASILFSEKKYTARSAAFINSLYGHGAELDDGNRKAMGHVGVHVIPAVLALAEAELKGFEEVMTAVAVGYETYIRISAAAQPGMVNRGIHSTGMAGAIACGAACAKLLGLDAKKIESAMSLASTMSSGLLTYSESRQMVKPLNPAKAAETGVFAARLASEGVEGPLNFLEGPNGWLHAVADVVDEKIITDDISDHLLIHDCYIKIYPSCRHTHCGIEAAINIHRRINIEEIKKVVVHIYPNAIKLAGQIRVPKEPEETKFSIHYTLACALLYGEYNVDYMNPPRNDSFVIDMIHKIELVPDETMENRECGIRGTCVKVIMRNGEMIEESILIPKGDPEKPLVLNDILDKLRTCAKDLVDEDSLGKLIKHILSSNENELINAPLLFMSGRRMD